MLFFRRRVKEVQELMDAASMNKKNDGPSVGAKPAPWASGRPMSEQEHAEWMRKNDRIEDMRSKSRVAVHMAQNYADAVILMVAVRPALFYTATAFGLVALIVFSILFRNLGFGFLFAVLFAVCGGVSSFLFLPADLRQSLIVSRVSSSLIALQQIGIGHQITCEDDKGSGGDTVEPSSSAPLSSSNSSSPTITDEAKLERKIQKAYIFMFHSFLYLCHCRSISPVEMYSKHGTRLFFFLTRMLGIGPVQQDQKAAELLREIRREYLSWIDDSIECKLAALLAASKPDSKGRSAALGESSGSYLAPVLLLGWSMYQSPSTALAAELRRLCDINHTEIDEEMLRCLALSLADTRLGGHAAAGHSNV